MLFRSHSIPAMPAIFLFAAAAAAAVGGLRPRRQRQIAAGTFVLLMVAIGLARILYGPADVDRILSVQLIGSGGVAVLLLLSVGMNRPPIMDVALMLGLLATFLSVTFLRDAANSSSVLPSTTEER